MRLLSRELDKRHRLVQETGEVRIGKQFVSWYRFGHVLFQQYLYDDLSAGERRLLHGDVAAALETLYEGRRRRSRRTWRGTTKRPAKTPRPSRT